MKIKKEMPGVAHFYFKKTKLPNQLSYGLCLSRCKELVNLLLSLLEKNDNFKGCRVRYHFSKKTGTCSFIKCNEAEEMTSKIKVRLA